MSDDAREVPAERWRGDLAYLREIPADERPRWRLAPESMNYAAAHKWARDIIRAAKIIRLSTGETLVCLPGKQPSPWQL